MEETDEETESLWSGPSWWRGGSPSSDSSVEYDSDGVPQTPPYDWTWADGSKDWEPNEVDPPLENDRTSQGPHEPERPFQGGGSHYIIRFQQPVPVPVVSTIAEATSAGLTMPDDIGSKTEE